MSNLTSNVVSVRSLVLTIAHKQAKAWLASGVVFFDSYAQALSFAMKKAWAAAKGSELKFSWEVEAAAPAVTGLLMPSLLEALAPKSFEVTESVKVQSGVNLSKVFEDMLEKAGHVWSWNNNYFRWMVPEYLIGRRLEVLGKSFYIVEFILESGNKFYYYAYFK